MQEQFISTPTNRKTMYVVNLDIQRMIILAGALFILLGGAFLAGSKWSAADPAEVAENDPGLLLEEIKTGEQQHLANALNQNGSETSGEIITPFEGTDNEVPVQKDPFISSPGKKSAAIPEQLKPAKKPEVHKATSGGGRYTLQIAAFVRESDANRLKKKLDSASIDARVVRGKKLFLVRAGSSSNKGILESLKTKVTRVVKVKPIIVKNQA